MSTNQGQSWTLMAGGIGNPLIIDLRHRSTQRQPNVNSVANPNPNGAEGKIVLAVPAATNNAVQEPVYAGWLYAAVATPSGGFDGLFVTKDFGENWTQIQLPSLAPLGNYNQAVPATPSPARPMASRASPPPTTRSPTTTAGQRRPRPDRRIPCRPDQPQYHLPGRLRRQQL